MLSPSRIYVPHETAADVGRRYRLRRAAQTACEAAALALFVGGVLAWSWLAEQRVRASVTDTEPTMIAQIASRATTPAVPLAPLRSIPARMADFITHHTASNGSVSRDDLLLDFTDEQIATHFETAKQLARNAGKSRR